MSWRHGLHFTAAEQMFLAVIFCGSIGFTSVHVYAGKHKVAEEAVEAPVQQKHETALAATPIVDSVADAEPQLVPAPYVVPEKVNFLEVVEGCDDAFGGTCLNVRSGPGVEYPAVHKLRTGMVLRVQKKVQGEDRDWYKVFFDEWVRYPDRISHEWYVAADLVSLIQAFPPEDIREDTPTSTKRIVVYRSDQKLYAYDGDTLFMKTSVSTGLGDTPTPRGSFHIYRKTPSRYMQGPVPGISDQEFDLPGVPWTMYFTKEGGAIHGAYWHSRFGEQWSHGCVNLPPEKAKVLYQWADLGTTVTVLD